MSTQITEKEIKEIQEEIKKLGEYLAALRAVKEHAGNVQQLMKESDVLSAIKIAQNALKTPKDIAKRLSEASKLLKRSAEGAAKGMKISEAITHWKDGWRVAETISNRWEEMSKMPVAVEF